ncbi:MAG TPA: hypothetical protein VGP35_09425 [Terriglobales bacterium]|jgi:hypothetical protein|nr:hypothetical protein [Candidatus Angelobacter sp.]HEV8047941.1 hypothetical protein [Terriglobales bacterium]
MKTLLTFALLAALGTGSAFMLRTEPSFNGSAQLTDGAFRDGLYLGRLAAQSGNQRHVAVGRWANLQDRSSFSAGYQQGYSEFLASRVAPTAGAQD